MTVRMSERGGRRSRRRALGARPALLLVDEPTARLDQANAIQIAMLLARIPREWETAVVCGTHDAVVIEQADARLSLERAEPRVDQAG